jgi:alpha-tubulin suppressor-like RCC1 family protein
MSALRALPVIAWMILGSSCTTAPVHLGCPASSCEDHDGGGPTAERCGDGIDDDGNGRIDDGCPCGPGESQACFEGPLASRRVGACVDGVQVCRSQGTEWGDWGNAPCEGGASPAIDRCDGRDADCDAAIDEGCPCATGDVRTCGGDALALAPCRTGAQTCVDGTWSDCVGAVRPASDVCDGIDNDCDGVIDALCGCVPRPERCGNGVDDDCDGTAEEVACTPGWDGSTCTGADGAPCSGGVCQGGSCCRGCMVGDECIDAPDTEGLCGLSGTACVRCVAPADTCEEGRCVARRGIVSLSVAQHHACAVDRLGGLWCWGADDAEQLGHELMWGPPGLVAAPLAGAWATVAAGGSGSLGHTCAIDVAGALYCWGFNQDTHAVGDPTAPDFVEAPHRIGSARWQGVALGDRSSCALDEWGSLWCWGASAGDQLGLWPTPLSNPEVPTPVDGTTGRRMIDFESLGWGFGCVLEADRRLTCWGRNDRWQLGATSPASIAPPAAVHPERTWETVAVGSEHACAIARELPGTIWCWGDNTQGQLAVELATTQSAEPVRVRMDDGLEDRWQAVSAGGRTTCGIRLVDGRSELWCWGSNELGKLGVGRSEAAFDRPQRVAGDRWAQVSVGHGANACAVDLEGVLWCWGSGASGVNGIPGFVTIDVPSPIALPD